MLRLNASPALFDKRGAFIQLIGNSGRGPGEYSAASDIVVITQDSIAIVDPVNLRVTVLNRALKPARYISLALSFRDHILVKWPSSVVIHGSIPTPQRAGFPLHRVSFADDAAVPVSSFGPGDHTERPDLLGSLFHLQSDGRSSVFWAATRSSYDLFEIRNDGVLLQTLERRPPWFSKPSPYNYPWKSEPPPPHVGSIAEDDEGLLWVFTRVAAPTWREAWPSVPKGVREVPVSQIDYRKLYWTRVEVIDPKAAALVAQTTLRFFLVSALDRRRVALYDEDDMGSVIRIASLALSR